ncbi:MAG: hypothetical protein LBM13_06235 [Candidatus Ancillula sp.]|jgi:hypothetical protein|nr:hypothetical protein [Candidatus Ancillula sp.]
MKIISKNVNLDDNKQIRVTIQVPEKWIQEDFEGVELMVIEKRSEVFSPNLNLTVVKDANSNLQNAEIAVHNHVNKLLKFEPITDREVDMNNHKWSIIEYSFEDEIAGDCLQIVASTIVTRGKNLYVFRFTGICLSTEARRDFGTLRQIVISARIE